MDPPFQPRVKKSDWSPVPGGSERDDTEMYPPGYVYEDIVDFYLSIFRIAYLGQKGLDANAEVDKNATDKTKEQATANQAETRKLIISVA